MIYREFIYDGIYLVTDESKGLVLPKLNINKIICKYRNIFTGEIDMNKLEINYIEKRESQIGTIYTYHLRKKVDND